MFRIPNVARFKTCSLIQEYWALWVGLSVRLGVCDQGLGFTWTNKACKRMAFGALFCDFGLLFYALLGAG